MSIRKYMRPSLKIQNPFEEGSQYILMNAIEVHVNDDTQRAYFLDSSDTTPAEGLDEYLAFHGGWQRSYH